MKAILTVKNGFFNFIYLKPVPTCDTNSEVQKPQRAGEWQEPEAYGVPPV
jgi:hypothetical protein